MAGLLARVFPPAVVRASIEVEGAGEQRKRLLPAALVAYVNLMLWLFPGHGYCDVLAETAKNVPVPVRNGAERATSTSISHARRRLGPQVMWRLFRHVAGAVANLRTPGAFWRGRRVCAVDGTTVKARDSDDNAAAFGGPRSSPFPLVRLLALAECATRSIIEAVWSPYQVGERTLVLRLLAALRPGMLVTFDRGFLSHLLFRDAVATGADLLFRVSSSFKLTPAGVLKDGTYLAELKPARKRDGPPILVRVIEYTIVSTTANGKRRSELFALVTNLTDPDEAPAGELAALYARRWQIEIVFKALKVDLAACKPVFRSATADGVIAGIWSLLAVYQAIGRLAGDAASQAGIDPRQISFKRARNALARTIGATLHLSALMVAFAADVAAHLTRPRPGRTTERRRKARRGKKIKTTKVQHKIIFHPMAQPAT
jgi:hypothetical protein